MTEDEAKTKQCPIFAHGWLIQAALFGAIHQSSKEELEKFGEATVYCCASECMWWVWDMYEIQGGAKGMGHCGAVK